MKFEIKLLSPGEFLFEGGRQTRAGLPLFDGIVSFSPEEQVEVAVILRRKGEKEYLRVGGTDFAFYFKESGWCNMVIKDYAGGRASVYPLSPVEQEELRRLFLISLYKQGVSLYLEGNLITKDAEESRVEINGVLLPEVECWKLYKALELGARYRYEVNGVPYVEAGLTYALSGYYLSTDNAFKLQTVFEVASLFFKPSSFSVERAEAGK